MMSAKVAIAQVATLLALAGSLPCVSQSVTTRQQQIESHSYQAQQFLKENRPDLAIPELRAILALDPNNVDARGNLGILLFFQGNYAEAIPQLEATLKLRPTLWKVLALLGIAEKRTGNAEKARSDLEKAFPELKEQKVQIQAGMELIDIYSAAGDLDKAAATVGALRSSYPTDVEVLYTSYRIYSDLAGESMLSLSLVAPKSALMYQVMAHELAKQGDTEGAITNYREALKLAPQLPALHFELAEALNTSPSATDTKEVENEYKRAISLNPFDEHASERLGEIAFRRGDLQAAYTYYSRAVELQPNDPDALVGVAKTLVLMSQPDKAEPLLERAVELDPTSAAAHYRLAMVYRSTGRTADAKRELDEYQKYKKMKEELRELYHEMRLKPAQHDADQTDTPN